nr:unnamed protein product [Digitaria exilis]
MPPPDQIKKNKLRVPQREEAKGAEDEKKVVNIARYYEKAADMVIAAPPAEKLKVMEETFNAAVAPDPAGCPTVDKSFCETSSKIQEVYEKFSTLIYSHKASVWHDADEKKVVNIARSYEKAADMVIAAPPAEKLKVMQEAFNAAAADAAIAAAPAETLKVMEEAFKAATVHPDA